MELLLGEARVQLRRWWCFARGKDEYNIQWAARSRDVFGTACARMCMW